MSVHGSCDPVKLPPVKPEAHFGFKLPRDRYRALALDTPLHTIPSASVDPDKHVYVIRFPIPLIPKETMCSIPYTLITAEKIFL